MPLREWAAPAQEALNAMFVLAASPHAVSLQLLQALAHRVVEPCPPTTQQQSDDEDDVKTTSNENEKHSDDDDGESNEKQNDEDDEQSSFDREQAENPVATATLDEDNNNDNSNNDDDDDDNNNNNDNNNNDNEQAKAKQNNEVKKMKMINRARTDALGKLVYTVGHVALKLLSYIEQVHAADVKRATLAAEQKQKAQNNKKSEGIEAELGEVSCDSISY